MSDLETYNHIPLAMDPATKAINTSTSGSGSSSSSSRTLAAELAALNILHRSLLAIDTPPNALVPTPTVPVNPKRSAQITKLRDSGNAEHRKGKHAEAIKLYTLGLQMALARPSWEPQGLVREEASHLYANRAQAHMALQQWVEGSLDAEASVEAKRVGNAKAWWRRARCLLEMGKATEARDVVVRGLEMEGEEGELSALLKEIEGRLEAE